MSFYRLEFPLKGTFEPEGNLLSGTELIRYEREIQYMLHDIEVMEDAQDNGRLTWNLPEGDLCQKIRRVDISVYTRQGEAYAGMEMETTLPFTEKEEAVFCQYLRGQFEIGWGNWFEEKPIYVEGHTLRVHLEEPADYKLLHKKYEITEIPHPKYPWLHRIRALVRVNENVERGDLGGYVESENNLSQEGYCWIYDSAVVCEGAVVDKDGRLFDGAMARDSVLVTGNARLFENATAEGFSYISGGELRENARAAGDAVIKPSDNGQSPLIKGESNIYGTVCGWFIIDDNIFQGERLINPTEDMFVLEHGKRSIMVKQRNLKPPEQRQENARTVEIKKTGIER